MRNQILILISLISLPVWSCEIKNDDYYINLLYKNGYISYVLKNKNGTDVELLNSIYTIGFEIKDYKFSEPKYNMKNIEDRYNYMLIGNGNYFSYYMVVGNGAQRIILPIDKINFSNYKSVENEIHLEKFISEFRSLQENKKYNDTYNIDNILPYGGHVIIPKVKVILDPEIKTCIDFSGEPFEYNFGNKYIYRFNVWWLKFKEKTNKTWKAIVE